MAWFDEFTFLVRTWLAGSGRSGTRTWPFDWIKGRIIETVNKIEALLSEIVKLQREYVKRVCTRCKASCCTRVHYLFTDKDILFLKLSGRRQSWKREAFTKKGCWFPGPAGCMLEPGSRPFICHHYICSDLKAEIEDSDSALMNDLEEKFKEIGILRSQMWAEYLNLGEGL